MGFLIYMFLHRKQQLPNLEDRKVPKLHQHRPQTAKAKCSGTYLPNRHPVSKAQTTNSFICEERTPKLSLSGQKVYSNFLLSILVYVTRRLGKQNKLILRSPAMYMRVFSIMAKRSGLSEAHLMFHTLSLSVSCWLLDEGIVQWIFSSLQKHEFWVWSIFSLKVQLFSRSVLQGTMKARIPNYQL